MLDEIKIVKMYEQGGQLRIEVEHEFGKENLGLSLDAKAIDFETGIPKWQLEVKELLEKKYGRKMKNINTKIHGKTVKMDELDKKKI